MSADRPERGFAEPEFAARTARAQAAMAARGMSGLLLTTEPEIRYFSGFQTLFWQSPTRPWFLFVPAAGKPIAVIPEIGAALMRRTWLDDIRTWPAPAPHDDGVALLTEVLTPLAARGDNLGVMKGHETHLRMPLGDWERLMAALPGIAIHDATALVQGLRMVKSAAEIAKLAHICAIGSATFDSVPGFAHSGEPLEEVFRAFRRAALAQGADDVPYLVGGADQGGYADVISPPSRRPLQTGDVLMLDSGCVWDGMFCDFNRNWAIGRADDAARQAYDVLWRATEAGIAAARPGARCCDVFAAMAHLIAKAGNDFTPYRRDAQGDSQPATGDIGRLGHGLGMQLTEQPSLAAFDTTVLRAGMALTIEPSLSYGDGLMMVHEENIIVQEGAARLLTRRAPDALPVL